ncbi:14300_t:CDS:1, partial [Ambispora leptoticha]
PSPSGATTSVLPQDNVKCNIHLKHLKKPYLQKLLEDRNWVKDLMTTLF